MLISYRKLERGEGIYIGGSPTPTIYMPHPTNEVAES